MDDEYKRLQREIVDQIKETDKNAVEVQFLRTVSVIHNYIDRISKFYTKDQVSFDDLSEIVEHVNQQVTLKNFMVPELTFKH